MADIVDRLRASGQVFYEHRETECILYHEAADGIERPRAELTEAKAATEAAVKAERERCAMIAEEFTADSQWDAGGLIASAIRDGDTP